ncbi:uncharacterized protein N7496_012334 [Penicillium cataractarum]|uniref:Uncharacterized protein n=1 Tax=Penicillium cataractarum TaxID=2100454 RepID=A0A9W9URX8_9EURO|nr:uncharacterized protein N7496_012334 [Penicillium cataractarum]KAJ5355122.1 hypothetical protein N7496_012334 [Penicillium cataractarum]
MAPQNISEFLANSSCAASAAPAASNASSSSCGPVPLASVASLIGLSENSINSLYWLGVLACLGYLFVYLVTIITNYRLKIKEMELGVFLAAAQSDEQTLRLSYLLRQTRKLHSLGVWGLWIGRSCTDQTMCVDDRPFLLVYKSRNDRDSMEQVTVGGKVLLVGFPLGGNKPPSLT